MKDIFRQIKTIVANGADFYKLPGWKGTNIEDVRIANTTYLKLDDNGDILVFALKTYNYGLDTNNRIEYAKGQENTSVLKIGYLGQTEAIHQIKCSVLE